jgi:hypothetical protein
MFNKLLSSQLQRQYTRRYFFVPEAVDQPLETFSKDGQFFTAIKSHCIMASVSEVNCKMDFSITLSRYFTV